MKRSVYGRRNALLRPGFSRTGIALCALVLLVLLLRVLFPGLLARAYAPIASFGAGGAAFVSGLTAVATGPASLSMELATARARIAELEASHAVLESRVKDLTHLLGSRVEPQSGTLAGVLLRPPESTYDALVIDQGSDAGVGVGALVLGAGGVPVGRIASVTLRTARVTLYSAPGVSTEGWAGEAKHPITIQGMGAGTFLATAPHGAGLMEGDFVYLPGPGAVPVGRIIEVESDPASPSATVRIEPLLNPFQLTWVTVLPVVALP